MDSLSNTITVLSANCRGLADLHKCRDVLNYLQSLKADILCLQDTHWTKSELRKIKSIWNHECLINGLHTNSRNVTILFSNKFEYNIENIIEDINGNLIAVNMTISNDLKLLLVNIYGPNKDSPEFYQDLENIINNNSTDYTLVCGDLNIAINPTSDSINYANTFNTSNPKSRKKVIEIMSNFDLVDVYRYLNPNSKQFTWNKPNSNKKARLDYFLASNSMMDLIPKTNIRYGHRSDHSVIELKIELNKFVRGRGTWKFNSSLLGNKDYVELINNTIDNTVLEYVTPVYNLSSIPNIPPDEIVFTINDGLLLDTLLMNIQGKTIRFFAKEI